MIYTTRHTSTDSFLIKYDVGHEIGQDLPNVIYICSTNEKDVLSFAPVNAWERFNMYGNLISLQKPYSIMNNKQSFVQRAIQTQD